MKKIILFTSIVINVLFLYSCGETSSTKKVETSEMTKVKTRNDQYLGGEIKIGDQIWMSKNLNVSKFVNGDPIIEAKTNEAWIEVGQKRIPAWCYYKNDSINGQKYGKLYNWFAVIDPRGLAPEGWHIPSEKEWQKLIETLGGVKVAGTKMKSNNGWKNNGNGTNESGFQGLPGGYRYEDGTFYSLGSHAYWYSTTKVENGKGWYLYLYYDYGYAHWYEGDRDGFSIRCIKG